MVLLCFGYVTFTLASDQNHENNVLFFEEQIFLIFSHETFLNGRIVLDLIYEDCPVCSSLKVVLKILFMRNGLFNLFGTEIIATVLYFLKCQLLRHLINEVFNSQIWIL